MRAFVLGACVALLAVAPAAAQSYFNTRHALAGGYSMGTDLLATDSGYVMATQTAPGPQFYRDLTLLFTDANGQAVTSRTYQWPFASLYTGSSSFIRLPDGGMALVGSRDPGPGMLWRFDARGDTLWTRAYPGPTESFTQAGCRMADDGFVLTGVQRRLTSATSDILLLRTDSLGHERWRRTYPVGLWAAAYHVLATADGGLLLCGNFRVRDPSVLKDYDGIVMKLDSLGAVEWQHTFGRRFFDSAGTGIQTPDGGYLVGGSWSDTTITISYHQTRPVLIKLDAQGREQWRRRYGPLRTNTESYRLHALPDGSYLLAGQMGDPTQTPVGGYTSPVGFLLNVCPDGDSLWMRSYRLLQGADSKNYLRDVVPTPDGGFAGAGFVHVRPPDTGTPDAWLFKTDRSGHLVPGQPAASPVCVVGLGPDDADAGGAGAAGEGVEVFPNPSPDGRFTLRLSGGNPATVTAEVLDATGRAVGRARRIPPGADTVLDLRAQPAGVYALRLAWADGRRATRRLLVSGP